MDFHPKQVTELARLLNDSDVTTRHRTQTRQEFDIVYGIQPVPDHEEIETVFRIAIQARAQPLNRSEYQTLLEDLDPVGILEKQSRQEAFKTMLKQKHIGQKVANEFLRIAVDVLTLNPDWRDDLHVALDTNVVQALVKTGAITLPETERDRGASEIVNMNPESTPTKLVGYSEVQEAFAKGAATIDEPRIVFDELWTEHRSFISDPLLRDQSVFSEELVEWVRN